MNKLKCVIIDDDQGAHLVINHYIKEVKTLLLMGSFYNAIEGLEYLYKNEVDIIFLDINMPGLSGIEMLEILSTLPHIILTTAYAEYALEGYKYEVVDYLVKPFDFKFFLLAIDKVMKKVNIEKNTSFVNLQYVNHLILKENSGYIKINFTDIIYIQSYGNYIKIFIVGKMILSPITTTEIENKLDKNIFIRIHRSYIVSLAYINKISGKLIYLRDGSTLPIGNTFKRELISKFKDQR